MVYMVRNLISKTTEGIWTKLVERSNQRSVPCSPIEL